MAYLNIKSPDGTVVWHRVTHNNVKDYNGNEAIFTLSNGVMLFVHHWVAPNSNYVFPLMFSFPSSIVCTPRNGSYEGSWILRYTESGVNITGFKIEAPSALANDKFSVVGICHYRQPG